jgi:small-conductance mechanosensitive channel
MTVRDSFHANGIEIPLLQREPHIKDGIQKIADELDAC